MALSESSLARGASCRRWGIPCSRVGRSGAALGETGVGLARIGRSGCHVGRGLRSSSTMRRCAPCRAGGPIWVNNRAAPPRSARTLARRASSDRRLTSASRAAGVSVHPPMPRTETTAASRLLGTDTRSTASNSPLMRVRWPAMVSHCSPRKRSRPCSGFPRAACPGSSGRPPWRQARHRRRACRRSSAAGPTHHAGRRHHLIDVAGHGVGRSANAP